MICRMNKIQREALLELIDAKIERQTVYTSNNSARIKREQNATNAFHKAFENESSEDDYNHVEGA